jgi:uncharacterized membrane protein
VRVYGGDSQDEMKLVTDIRSSFWFVPSLIVVVACAPLAIGAIELDGIIGSDALTQFPRLFGARAEGARELLSAIGASTITAAGVVFSITIVALSLTAAQYSPRVLRNLMATQQTQLLVQLLASLATIARTNNHEEQRGAVRKHVRAIQEAAGLSRMPRTHAKVLSAALEEALGASNAEPLAGLERQRHHEAEPRAPYGPGRGS